MSLKNWLPAFAVVWLALGSVSISAQRYQRGERQRSFGCENCCWSDRYESFCEVRESTLPSAPRALNVDGGMNGGVEIESWDRDEVRVRARVSAQADTESEAREIVSRITVETDGGRIESRGPSMRGHVNWAVSFRITVPRRTDLDLKTFNGGISISNVAGRIDFEALNGGVSLTRLSGNVRGHTTNGGLTVELDGASWDGEGLDVRTTNGGVVITFPKDYSAHLETGTVNGGFDFDFPITVQGRIRKNLSVDLGNGGTTIRATTINGQVQLRRG